MKVVISREASADLEDIADYIARDNPVRARSFVAELIDKAHELGTMAKTFPLMPRYRDLGVRRRVHGNYVIFYRIEVDRILILHIVHGARDYEVLLFPEQ